MARWALITGEKGTGKADYVLGVAMRLRMAGLRVAGFVQLRKGGPEGPKGYELLRLANGKKIALAQEGVAARDPSQEAFCTYAFSNDAFEQACGWVKEDAAKADVLVLDDVSKLETQGKGHAAALAWALQQPGKIVLISARASQLFYVVENFGLDEPLAALELPVKDAARAAFVDALLKAHVQVRTDALAP